jgi:hypothetical protein
LALTLEGLKLFGIALGSLLVLAVVFFVSIKTGIVVPVRWVGLCGWTGLLIWFICKQCKRHIRQARFWVTFLGLLLIHVIAFIAALQKFPEWRLAWFALIFIVEAPFLVIVIETVIRREHSRKHPTPSTPD